MITSTSLTHPSMVEKILNALVESEAKSKANGERGTSYIQNKHGNNVMRLDIYRPGCASHLPKGGVVVFGAESRQITAMVEKALGISLNSLI